MSQPMPHHHNAPGTMPVHCKPSNSNISTTPITNQNKNNILTRAIHTKPHIPSHPKIMHDSQINKHIYLQPACHVTQQHTHNKANVIL